nr:ATP-binding protein [uncultured Cohaesibacter sp.]
MPLAEEIKVGTRFQRSIRIDTDVNDADIVKSYVCPKSSVDVLLNMAKGFSEVGEAAFTWTGPYGSGKSSLVVALSALIGESAELRKVASRSIDSSDIAAIHSAFGVNDERAWDVVPVVGFKGNFEAALRGQLKASFKLTVEEKELDTIDLIDSIARKRGRGLLIAVDEMGKFLEAAAEGTSDIYFFQLLAEKAVRSEGRILFLGILHQAFAEYGKRLTRDIRDEWSKIQGRFIDLPLNVAGEELIELLGKAIQTSLKPKKATPLAKSIAKDISRQRLVNADVLAANLNQCWPLHPVSAALLGPISRRRFAQNQRSIFGFLNSSEPFGFQEYLKKTETSNLTLFMPDMIWDYLQYNLESSIMASPDGHRWSTAVDALARAEAYGADDDTLSLVKVIALIDLFHERSGLIAEIGILSKCVLNINKERLAEMLRNLENWSILLFRKHKGSYSLYEGSDFDIDAAIEEAYDQIPRLDLDRIRSLAEFQPIVAKKHYHETGALRWMDVDLAFSDQTISRAEDYKPSQGGMGTFLVILGSGNEDDTDLEKACANASNTGNQWPIVTSVAKNSYLIRSHARELQALEWIKNNNLAIGGDTIARREVESRLFTIKNQLIEYLEKSLSNAKWFIDGKAPVALNLKDLHQLTSKFADKIFHHGPIVNSELANRIRPSSNSNAALKALMKAMVEKVGQDRLGIVGYPAEGGLYEILLKKSELYDGCFFVPPSEDRDPSNFLAVWEAADQYFEENKDHAVPLTELYEIWSLPPYGIKAGLLPFFAIAYIMSKINGYATYLGGVYRPSIDDLFVDVLMKAPADIALRPMNFTDVGQRILAGVCTTLNKVNGNGIQLSETSKPLAIAKNLVSVIMNLPPWVLRTRQLSPNAIRLRELIKTANDPNKVLFDDLPHLFKEHEEALDRGDVQPIIDVLESSIQEMINAYPNLLDQLKRQLYDELQFKLNGDLSQLKARAENIMHISGDFKLDAFATRLANFQGSIDDIEGIASLAADKPTRDWIDLDVNRAKLHIAELSQQFNHQEAFGRVHNRKDFRQSVAFMVGTDGSPKTYVKEFTINRDQRKTVTELGGIIKAALNGHTSENTDILLAALAEIGAEILESEPMSNNETN